MCNKRKEAELKICSCQLGFSSRRSGITCLKVTLGRTVLPIHSQTAGAITGDQGRFVYLPLATSPGNTSLLTYACRSSVLKGAYIPILSPFLRFIFFCVRILLRRYVLQVAFGIADCEGQYVLKGEDGNNGWGYFNVL